MVAFAANLKYPSSDAHASPDGDADGAVNMTDLNIQSAQSGKSIERGRLSGSGNIVGYAGYIFEPATGMYVVRHRWYSTENGRWLSKDPLEYADGQGSYEYVRSRPVQFLDPTGLHTWLEGGEAAIISWVAHFNAAEYASEMASYEVHDHELDRAWWDWQIITIRRNQLLVPMLALRWTSNNPPPDTISKDNGPSAWGSQSHRGYIYLKPEICCTDLGFPLLFRAANSGSHVGYTPAASWYYDIAESHSTLNGSVKRRRERDCVIFTIENASRIGWHGQFANNVVTMGRTAPYISRRIVYRICCNGTLQVEYTGSRFPSHKSYYDGTAIFIWDQIGIAQFMYSGDRGDDRMAPRSSLGSYSGFARKR